MTEQVTLFKVVEIILQIILVIFAGMALSVWKKEIQGKDRYNQVRALLEYIEKLNFTVSSKTGSKHFICINDIFTNRSGFYSDQMLRIGKDKVFFDESVFGLFHHINIRSNFFLTKEIRDMLSELVSISAEKLGIDKRVATFISISGVKIPKILSLGGSFEENGAVYVVYGMESLTIEAYFRKWERLVRELKKLVFC